MAIIKTLLAITLFYFQTYNIIAEDTINQTTQKDSTYNTSQLENILEVHPRQGIISSSDGENPILAALIEGPGVIMVGYSKELELGGIIHYDELTKGFGGLIKMYGIGDILSPNKSVAEYEVHLYQGEYDPEILNKIRKKFKDVNNKNKNKLKLNIVKTDTTSCDGKIVILNLIKKEIYIPSSQEIFQNITPSKSSKIEWIDKTLIENKDNYSN